MPETTNPEVTAAPSVSESKSKSLDLLLDVPVNVTVELGRKKMSISELVDLTKGATIELEKAAGELLDVRVNDRLLARGEAVIINDKFGIRLTEIVSRTTRVEQLS